MNFFEYTDKELFFRNDGELLSIMAWGNNSLRVQSSLMDKIPDGCVALINPDVDNMSDIDIKITDERHAHIRNGLITAKLYVQEWGNALQISFYNEKNELILREIANGGALTKKARYFHTLNGDSYRLKASFEPSASEKIYGIDRKSTRLNSSHTDISRMPSSA